ncbi:urease accessory protein UreE [Sphingobacterium siyangense]|jgi:urease accessory protein|uniref:urease accessory protein UreE n=1 Tax=Sphingobacterium siyangense TaxID=459529 RepID=UPI0028AC729C|nr:urease accessory protein UreE [Sphingobacterium siyangense]
MIITEITRNIQGEQINKRLDSLAIEWYESTKRIQRLRTAEGMDIAVKLLGNTSSLQDGDILYEDEEKIVVVTIKPCEVICVMAIDFLRIAFVSSEIGNKHLPLFVEANELLMPYERSMYEWLAKQGFDPQRCERQLLRQFNANVDPKHHQKMKFSTKNIPLLISDKAVMNSQGPAAMNGD